MFGSFRARLFALAASLFVILWAAPAAAAETNPNLEGLGTLVVQPAPAPALPGAGAPAGSGPLAVAPGALKALRPLHDLVISFVDYGNQGSEELCLAKAVYFEARGETLDGQLAVAQVVLNRASSGVYPPTVCGVVTQHAQFSFVRGGHMPPPDTASDCWKKALAIADIAMKRLAATVAPNVLWYHASYVAPAWGRQHVRVTRIGTHIFYS
ncbi:MAG: cell wall hydrolase [Alphaproteobacteria bacterium]|nr:cell wall hydrolase [Alphaproteobacteria bacterium]